jgi:hypothetical protein
VNHLGLKERHPERGLLETSVGVLASLMESSDLVAAAQSADRTGLLPSDRYKNSGACVGLSRDLYIDHLE